MHSITAFQLVEQHTRRVGRVMILCRTFTPLHYANVCPHSAQTRRVRSDTHPEFSALHHLPARAYTRHSDPGHSSRLAGIRSYARSAGTWFHWACRSTSVNYHRAFRGPRS